MTNSYLMDHTVKLEGTVDQYSLLSTGSTGVSFTDGHPVSVWRQATEFEIKQPVPLQAGSSPGCLAWNSFLIILTHSF